MTYKEKSLEIIKHYGVMKQLKYFQSEIFELNEAIIQYETIKDYEDVSREHIFEEIADVQVMINQFKEYYKLNELQLKSIMEFKIDRQLKRIKDVK